MKKPYSPRILSDEEEWLEALCICVESLESFRRSLYDFQCALGFRVHDLEGIIRDRHIVARSPSDLRPILQTILATVDPTEDQQPN